MVINMSTGSPVYTAGLEKYSTLESCNKIKESMLSMEKEALAKRFTIVKKGEFQLSVKCQKE
jgi:hypothetical protein